MPAKYSAHEADRANTVAEVTARAQQISQDAGARMASAMGDVLAAATGLAGFAVESARDLVQFMVRRGQMSQEEADRLMRDAEHASRGRRARARDARYAAIPSPAQRSPTPSHTPKGRAPARTPERAAPSTGAGRTAGSEVRAGKRGAKKASAGKTTAKSAGTRKAGTRKAGTRKAGTRKAGARKASTKKSPAASRAKRSARTRPKRK